MAEMITRCPKCGTAFRITGVHIKSAKGSVRCGSCLRVFDAWQNLTEESKAAYAAQLKLTEPLASADTPADDEVDDDVLIGDDADETNLLRTTDPSSNLFERSHQKRESTEEDKDSSDDESWALDLLDNETEPTDTPKSKAKELKPAAAKMKSFRLSPSNRKSAEWVGVDKDKQVDFNDEEKELFDHSSFTADRHTYLDAIEPEPVEFSVRSHKPFWQRRWVWGVLSTLAILLLAAQLAWLQYPTLNRVEPYRGFYAAACELIGCELPAQLDRAAIRTSNLVVRTHPRVENALMVDVILQNTAPFEQRFPQLELSFSDLQGNLIAQRRFTPDEYLGGELAGQTHMPVRQPIHIAVEIVDPGRQAVNYRVDVVGKRSQ